MLAAAFFQRVGVRVKVRTLILTYMNYDLNSERLVSLPVVTPLYPNPPPRFPP